MLGNTTQLSLSASPFLAHAAAAACSSSEALVGIDGPVHISGDEGVGDVAITGSDCAVSGCESARDGETINISTMCFGSCSPFGSSGSSPAGGGGSIGSAGAPTGGNGGNGSGKPGLKMDALRVINCLEALKMKKGSDIETDEAVFLENAGLVVRYSGSRYGKMRNKVDRMPTLRREVRDLEETVNAYDSRRNFLRARIDSRWHVLFSFADTLRREIDELQDVEFHREKRDARLKAALQQLNDAYLTERELKSVVTTGSGEHLSLTEKGRDQLRNLLTRTGRLEGVAYDAIAEEIGLIEESVAVSYERWNEVYGYLRKRRWEEDSRVANFALALAAMDGEFESNYERAMAVNRWLYTDKKWESYSRLGMVSAIMGQEGDIEDLKDELVKVVGVMVGAGHENTRTTWREAAAIMKIPGEDAGEKYERYKAMFQSISGRGWSCTLHPIRLIVADLAQMPGDIEDIAEEFQNLENAIVATGRERSTESAMAAMILYPASGTDQEKAERFNRTFESMDRYGWDRNVSFYAAAAAISLLPGTVGENVQLVCRMTNLLKKDGYTQELTNRSVRLVGSGYRDMAMMETAPDFIAAHVENTSAFGSAFRRGYDSDGFSMGGAVVGDILDDGLLNLSGGFILGGLFGDLFE